MSADPTELTYSSDVKEWLNIIFKDINLIFKRARVEETKGKKRADILVYDHSDNCILIIEVKRPNIEADDGEVKDQVYRYSELFGIEKIKYVATHNVNRLIIWDTDTNRRVRQFQITNIDELKEYYSLEDEIKESLKDVFIWIGKFLKNEEAPRSIDEDIIEIMHKSIEDILIKSKIVHFLKDKYLTEKEYREKFDNWLVDQGYSHPGEDESKLTLYCTILSKQFIYMFINKVLFFNILKQKFSLPNFIIQEGLVANHFHSFIQPYFDNTIKITGDYETIFQTNFVDSIEIPDDTINELRKITSFLGGIDYSKIEFDIIGKIFEKIIPKEERHYLGQFFTRSDIVDLIIGFCIKNPNLNILDPGCGTGTFLVRAYRRLRYLGNKKPHKKLIKQIWGIDIAKFPVHLATINLAIRDIKSEDNYPLIVYNDFFDVFPDTRITIGTQTIMDNWTKDKSVQISTLDESSLKHKLENINTIIGNPPFTRQEELKGVVFGEEYKAKMKEVLVKDFNIEIDTRAGIYAYFITHSASFIKSKNGNRLGFVTLRSWLDVGFGEKLKQFLLDNFKIVAVIQSLKEKWFPDAQMIPCIIIIERESKKNERDENYARFIQVKTDMTELIPVIKDEDNKLEEIERWKRIDELIEKIEGFPQNIDEKSKTIEKFRRITIDNGELYRILSIKQKYLESKSKWGVYLTAPLLFFKILEDQKYQDFLIKLGGENGILDISSGLKTGANAFFYFPNSNFEIEEINKKYLKLKGKKKYKDQEFIIESEFISPIFIKFKPQRKIFISENDGYCLTVSDSKNQLKKDKKNVLKYIEFGEQNPKKDPYSQRSTCQSRKTKNYRCNECKTLFKTKPKKCNKCESTSIMEKRDWFNIEFSPSAQLLHFEVETNRELTFIQKDDLIDDVLDKKIMTNYGFYNLTPKRKEDAEIINGILNSTFGTMIMEFGGRYIENRDGTISNETRVSDLKEMWLINPEKITDNQQKKLIELTRKIGKRDILKIWEEFEKSDRKELDKLIFTDILGIDQTDINELYDSLSLIVKNRNTRKK